MTSPTSSIMLVDDHPLLRRGLQQLPSLADNLEASNLAETITPGVELDPDQIFLDLTMQGLNASETLNWLRDEGVTSHTVMLTVFDADEDVLEAISWRGVSSRESLTAREREILKLIAKGSSNELIGRELGVSDSTVKVHVKHLLNKLGLRSRVEAAVWMVHNKPAEQ